MNELSQLRRSSAIEDLLAEDWLADIDWLAEIDSTNDFLKRSLLSQSQANLPRLAVADRQTAGRGRGQNGWWSPEGCLMFSLAWRPEPALASGDTHFQSRFTQLPLIIGMAIADAVRGLLVDRKSIQVKWPNDVYVDNKKLGGVLIESVLGSDQPFWIIGVGINVNVAVLEAPEPIRSNATSLHLECLSAVREELCVESILMAVIHHIRLSIDQWQSDQGFLHQAWPNYCMLTNRWVEIRQADRAIIGTCRGIDDRGALMIDDQHRQQHAVLSGVVQSWR